MNEEWLEPVVVTEEGGLKARIERLVGHLFVGMMLFLLAGLCVLVVLLVSNMSQLDAAVGMQEEILISMMRIEQTALQQDTSPLNVTQQVEIYVDESVTTPTYGETETLERQEFERGRK